MAENNEIVADVKVQKLIASEHKEFFKTGFSVLAGVLLTICVGWFAGYKDKVSRDEVNKMLETHQTQIMQQAQSPYFADKRALDEAIKETKSRVEDLNVKSDTTNQNLVKIITQLEYMERRMGTLEQEVKNK